MPHRLAIVTPIDVAVKGGGLDLVEGREEKLHCADAIGGRFRRHSIQFAAIAGRKHQSFGENAACAQLLRGLTRLLRSKRDALAQLHRGRAVIESYEDDLHRLSSPSRESDWVQRIHQKYR